MNYTIASIITILLAGISYQLGFGWIGSAFAIISVAFYAWMFVCYLENLDHKGNKKF